MARRSSARYCETTGPPITQTRLAGALRAQLPGTGSPQPDHHEPSASVAITAIRNFRVAACDDHERVLPHHRAGQRTGRNRRGSYEPQLFGDGRRRWLTVSLADGGRSARTVQLGAAGVLVTAQPALLAGHGCVRADDHERGLLDAEVRSHDDVHLIVGPVPAGMTGFLLCLGLAPPVGVDGTTEHTAGASDSIPLCLEF